MNISNKIIKILDILLVRIVWINLYNIFNKISYILNSVSVHIMVLRSITIFYINIWNNMIWSITKALSLLIIKFYK